MIAVIYQANGEISKCVDAPDDHIEYQMNPGEFWLEVSNPVDDSLNYVLNGVVTNKPVQPTMVNKLLCAADGLDTIEVTGIPIGATVTLGPLSPTAIISTASLTFDIAGEYWLKVELFPYRSFEVKISAT